MSVCVYDSWGAHPEETAKVASTIYEAVIDTLQLYVNVHFEVKGQPRKRCWACGKLFKVQKTGKWYQFSDGDYQKFTWNDINRFERNSDWLSINAEVFTSDWDR